jgi:hypothetical protein
MWLFCGSPRLCRLRTEGLVPVSKYWTYRSHAGVSGPSKPSSWSSTEAWLKSTASLAGLRRNWVQMACYGLCQEPFLSRVMGSIQIYWRLMNGCHVWGLPAGSISQAYVDWRGKRTCHVDRGIPCREYIDLNRCDSQIWVTACSWLPSSSILLD